MIHYHGLPLSGPQSDVGRFLSGRHALVPYKYQEQLGIALDSCQSIILDNSAFSYWKAGEGEVDIVEYHKWTESLAHHPNVDWCLIPDKIDGTEQENIDLVQLWLRMGSRLKCVPVWHMHESLEWLSWLTSNFQTVALGSSGQWSTPGDRPWWKRMSEAMNAICDKQGRPPCRLHGLRMLDPNIFSHLPLASADSTNATVNAGSVGRFGMYPHPNASGRAAVIADRIEANNSAPLWIDTPQLDLSLGKI